MSSNSDNIIASSWLSKEIFVYSKEGKFVSKVRAANTLYGAILTPANKIFASTWQIFDSKFLLMSLESNIVKEIPMNNPTFPSMFGKNTAYVAANEGVFEITKSAHKKIFSFPRKTSCWQVIRVQVGALTKYWTQERDIEPETTDNLLIRIYHIYSNDEVSLKDVTLPVTVATMLTLTTLKLAYDGSNSVLLSDKFNNAVHLFSANGDYQRQLLRHPQISNPLFLNINAQSSLLYVLQKGEIKIFSLVY